MREKEAVKQVFTKSEDAYITSSTHSTGSDLLLMKKWLKPESDMLVLDIATGGGHVAKHLSPYVKSIFATDLTKSMLEHTSDHLQSFQNIHFIIADAENLPFIDATFDIVTCRIAAHHFPHPETFIHEVQRVLKPKGKFLFIDNVASENGSLDKFVNRLEKRRDYSHVRSHKISEWKKFLQSFNIEQEMIRKKTLPFEEWVNRTLDDVQDQTDVENLLLYATGEIQDYFEVKTENNKVQSFAIDEWMVLCTK